MASILERSIKSSPRWWVVRLDSIDWRLGGVDARLDSHDRKFDELLDVANDHSRVLHEHGHKLDDLAAGR